MPLSLTRFAALALLAAVTGAQADTSRVLANPPVMPIESLAPHGLKAAPGVAGEKQFTWQIRETDNQLYNPSTGRYDKVRLRSYTGTGIDPSIPFAAPTIEVAPGDTVRATLINNLPANSDQGCRNLGTDINSPHCFNTTNMHAHGLWISPSGNSDNVLLSINPGVTFQYEYNIPTDHPAGTFWYHPHQHGATAIQVATGMAGTLIIRGNRLATETSKGDLDTLMDGITERVMLFQQIQYYCSGDGSKPEHYNCPAGSLGKINSYAGFGPGTWADSGRHTSINGVVLPIIESRVGEVERWRMIHAGVRDSLNVSIRRAKPALAQALQNAGGKLSALSGAAIDQYCEPGNLPQFAVAADGLTLPAVKFNSTTVFQPGYRWDLLMAFPEAGDYCVVDEQAQANANVTNAVSPPALLAAVRVRGAGKLDPRQHVFQTLLNNVQKRYSGKIANDISNDLHLAKLTRFTPHPAIADSEITGNRTAEFNITFKEETNIPEKFMINGEPFKPGRVDQDLTLGHVEQWTITSLFASHPFHIHVNPFQIEAIYDPSGKDVSAEGASDGGDPQYPGFKGAFKDTIWVKQGYTVKVRTRYQRYIGDFVLHCHILDHEDQGMMQNVRISLPAGLGVNRHSHH